MNKLSDFDYHLPIELIAQKPIEPRDHSRLLVLSKDQSPESEAKIEHCHFYDLPDYLKKGDLLVLNNSKVFPARLLGRRKGSGGRVEVFLLRFEQGANDQTGATWQCLIGGKKPRAGLGIEFDSENKYLLSPLSGVLMKDNQDGTWQVEFNLDYREMMDEVEKIGEVPLPPYIKREAEDLETGRDKQRYQTVYADESRKGSVAAPTAGFHFTPELMAKLKEKGIEFAYVTLHVGLGTFLPVKTDNITEHKMHAEYVEISEKAMAQIVKVKKEKRSVITVGTTSTRALEAVFQTPSKKDFSGWVNIFIYPGYEFKVVDGMITNFHLPKSTLLMLVSALAGRKNIKRAYDVAVKEGYRFFSYGDAMFIFFA